jgi:hypothetical protein
MTPHRAATPVLLVLLVLAGLLPCVGAATKPVESPLEIAPYPTVIAYATQQGIRTEGIAFASESAPPQPGDEVVYLLTLQQPASRKQWLVRLVSRQPDPAKGDVRTLADDTLYSSTGLELRYTNTPTALDVEFIGPFEASATGQAKVSVSQGHAVVSAESLQQGLVGYCEAAIPIATRLKAAGIDNPSYTGSSNRPKPDAIAAGRKAVAAFGLTAEEERLAFSVYFALRSFYQACSEIPACRNVLEQVIQKPSLWSIATNVGVNMNFEYGWHKVQPYPAGQMPVSTPGYLLPLRLSANGKPVLEARLLATSTQPPLRTCAGIFALAAAHPTDEGRRVYLRVLSAQPATR